MTLLSPHNSSRLRNVTVADLACFSSSSIQSENKGKITLDCIVKPKNWNSTLSCAPDAARPKSKDLGVF